MNAIMCELCGSNDVVKQGDYFVCQHCGTKYTLEDARKLIGTVRIDSSDSLQNYLEAARNAKEAEDWERAEQNYTLAEQNSPNNIEAIFYSKYAKAMTTLSVNNKTERVQCFQTLEKTIQNIGNRYVKAISTNQFDLIKDQELLSQISLDLLKMSSTKFVYNANYALTTPDYLGDDWETYKLFGDINLAFCDQIEAMISVIPNGKETEYTFLYSTSIINLTCASSLPDYINAEECAFRVGKIHKKWADFDSKHIIPDPQFAHAIVEKTKKNREKEHADHEKMVRELHQTMNKSNGCYVATAVYGSYDCPQVWTLRRYRDYTLAETWFGRLFIALYYAISPTLVKWFGETQWFKNLWKPRLDRMVKRLNDEGVVDTPYQDRQW